MDPLGALINMLGLGTPQKKKQDQKPDLRNKYRF